MIKLNNFILVAMLAVNCGSSSNAHAFAFSDLTRPFERAFTIKRSIGVHNDTDRTVVVKRDNSGPEILLGPHSRWIDHVGAVDAPTYHFSDPDGKALIRSIKINSTQRSVSFEG